MRTAEKIAKEWDVVSQIDGIVSNDTIAAMKEYAKEVLMDYNTWIADKRMTVLVEQYIKERGL